MIDTSKVLILLDQAFLLDEDRRSFLRRKIENGEYSAENLAKLYEILRRSIPAHDKVLAQIVRANPNLVNDIKSVVRKEGNKIRSEEEAVDRAAESEILADLSSQLEQFTN